MKIVCLPGDGIGPEVMGEAKRALEALSLPGLVLEDRLFGAAAIRATGDPLPAETLEACRSADAVLKAPIGDPEFDAADVRPEQGLMRLRSALDVFANLRPAQEGAIDLIIVRELVGGIYYGAAGRAPTASSSTPASTTRARSSASCGAASRSPGGGGSC